MAARAHAELDGAPSLPADRPVGIRARKSPEAIALILACLQARRPFLLPSVELAPETLAQAVRAGGRQPRARRRRDRGRDEREPARDRGRCPPRSDEPAPSGRRPAAATTSRSCSPPPARPGCRRSCRSRRAPSTASPTGPPRSSTSARARTSLNYAPLNFDLCLLDIWTTLKHGGCVVLVDQDRGDATAATSPT